MLFNLPLKQSKDVTMYRQIEECIHKEHQEPALAQQIKENVERTEKLRQNLNYEKINLSIATDPQTAENLENNLMEYLKNYELLFKHLRFEEGEKRSPQIPFMWSDSYDQKKGVQLNSGRLELVSQYYNLAMTYFYQANNRIIKDTDQERKVAITKLRNGLWSLEQLRKQLCGLTKDKVQVFVDLTTVNLEFLEHTFCGLAYKSLYQNMMSQAKTFGLNTVCGTLFESAKEFAITLKAVEVLSNQYQKQVGNNNCQIFQATIRYNYIWTTANACLQMAIFHYSKIADDSRGQNMGKALGFLNKATQLLQQILSDKNAVKQFSPSQLDSIKQIAQQIQQTSQEYQYKNQQIYKEQPVNEDLLPYPSLMEQIRIKPLEPPIYKEPVKGVEKFSGFVSEEALQLSREMKIYVDQSRYSLEESIRLFYDQKNSAYTDSYVGVLLDMAQSRQISQGKLPLAVQEKVKYIQSRGGWQGVQQLMETAKQASIICSQMIGQVEQQLLTEQTNDQELKKRYGAKWTRNPSQQLNQQYFVTLQDLKGKFLQAQKIDYDVVSKLESQKQFIQLALQNEDVIMQSLPKGDGNQDFYNQNTKLFNDLVAQDILVNELSEQLKKIVQQYNIIVQQTNYAKLATKSIDEGIPKDQAFNQALGNVSSLIEEFNNTMNQVSVIVSQTCCIAKELSAQKNKNMNQQQQQRGGSTNPFADSQICIDNCDHSVTFYAQLKLHLEELDRKVKDFIMARNLEQDQLLQTLSNQQTFQEQAVPPLPQQFQQSGYSYPTYPQYPQYPQQYPPQQQQQYPPPQQQYPQQQYPQQQYPQQQYGQWGQQPQKK